MHFFVLALNHHLMLCYQDGNHIDEDLFGDAAELTADGSGVGNDGIYDDIADDNVDDDRLDGEDDEVL